VEEKVKSAVTADQGGNPMRCSSANAGTSRVEAAKKVLKVSYSVAFCRVILIPPLYYQCTGEVKRKGPARKGKR
jgi:hypothetical protein